MNIKYAGSMGNPSGYGQANRTDIASLYLNRVNIQTESVSQMVEKTDFGWMGSLAEQLTANELDYKIKIIHLTPDCYKDYREKGKYHIGRLFFETDKLPKGWPEACNKMDEIWTATEPQAEMIKKSGVNVPIHCFPQPIDLIYSRNGYEIKGFSGYIFYSIFQWIERKNPRSLITTYWRTFEDVGNVILVLKTYGFGYSEQEFDRIKKEISSWKKSQPQASYPKILLVNKLFTTKQVMKLHATGDCFVTTTRGEGWDIPAVEALLSGKPVIGPDKTGVFDLLDSSNYLPCKTSQSGVIVDPRIPYYDYPQNWLDVDEEELKKNMLLVYKDSQKGVNLGKVGQKYVFDNLNFWKVGKMMKDRLEIIESKL